MMDYKLPPNLGICPECKESNAFLDRATDRATCTGCKATWGSEEAFINEQTKMIRLRLTSGKKSMIRQNTVVTYDRRGKVFSIKGGIEWTVKLLENGSYRKGFTCNPLGGCFHACEWIVPDGTIAECYAKSVAERVAMAAYPKGFEHMYWHPERLYDGLKNPESRRIFFDSMSDIFGHWVDAGKIYCILRAVEDQPQHDFQCLTKNPVRIPQFEGYIPQNLWVGFSSPPDFWMNKQLTRHMQERMLHVAFERLSSLSLKVKWASFEPLSWDLAHRSPVSKCNQLGRYWGRVKWAGDVSAGSGPCAKPT